ncbi:hypothetical protein V8C35DRAFT_293313 [Trichoderma chlorosporum]
MCMPLALPGLVEHPSWRLDTGTGPRCHLGQQQSNDELEPVYSNDEGPAKDGEDVGGSASARPRPPEPKVAVPHGRRCVARAAGLSAPPAPAGLPVLGVVAAHPRL